MKKLDKWVPLELNKNQKHHRFEVTSSLFYATITNHFLVGLSYATKSGFYMTTSNNLLSGWTKKLQSTSQSQTCTPKKVMVIVWWSAVGLIHYSFLNLGKTITSEKYAQQINEMHWKLQCLQPALVHRMSPILPQDNTWPHVAQPMLPNLNELGYHVLLRLPYSPDLLPTNYHFFRHLNNFLQAKCFHTSRSQKMLYKSSSNPEACIFTLKE